jgi:hypothetical protein
MLVERNDKRLDIGVGFDGAASDQDRSEKRRAGRKLIPSPLDHRVLPTRPSEQNRELVPRKHRLVNSRHQSNPELGKS